MRNVANPHRIIFMQMKMIYKIHDLGERKLWSSVLIQRHLKRAIPHSKLRI